MAEPVRIKEIPENELTPEQAKVFKDLVAGRGRLLTPYKIWIHSPKLAAALETIGTFLNKASSLTEREVELTICIVANHWKGEYVWAAHVKMCRDLGFPQEVFDAISAGQAPRLENGRERAVYDLAMIAMAPGGGSDEVFERAERLLGRNGIAEVIALLGYYSSVAMGMKLHRVPVPAPAR
jgi:4-carboxymuconolactone decarboxylase